MTYLIFLFTLEVVMLNLLIAQMSDTFSNVQGDAQRSLAINKARTIISIEKTGLTVLVSKINIMICLNLTLTLS